MALLFLILWFLDRESHHSEYQQELEERRHQEVLQAIKYGSYVDDDTFPF